MSDKMDLNRATATEIEKIPGVTRAVADRIIAARGRKKRFSSLSELQEIAGIDREIFGHISEAMEVVKSTEIPGDSCPLTIHLGGEGKHRGMFRGYRVSIRYHYRKHQASASTRLPILVTREVDQDGMATLDLPHAGEIEEMLVCTVMAPNGQVLEDREYASRTVLASPILELPVTPLTWPTLQNSPAPGFGKPSRLRGRVLDRAGRSQISNRQIILWGTLDKEPEKDAFRALAATQTDSTGYFSASYPLGQFSFAYATVALDRIESVTVHLSDTGEFPKEVILVVDAPCQEMDPSREGCRGGEPSVRLPDAGDLVQGGGFSTDVGQGHCVDFTRPDRTLQEFTFHYVVRTTEPQIKGMTLSEESSELPQAMHDEIHAFLQMKQKTSGVESDRESLSLKTASTSEFKVSAGLMAAMDRADQWTQQSFQELLVASKFNDIMRAVQQFRPAAPGRSELDCRHEVDWDRDPTIYQACTIAHGHLLHFKQEWVADGYSLGRLLYSLPLAPGQKKQIAVVDWKRQDLASRSESLEEREMLSATLTHDRDIGEVVNSVLNENIRGGSEAGTSSISAGLGIGAILGPVGALFGIGGGSSSANSSAWQDSSRDLSTSSLQTLRDRTSQSAASIRAQRATVVQGVSQREGMSVVTETVANYNHCHAVTMEYFEVLRHLIVRQRLTDVQECLFVPLPISRFDRAKALRWRNTMQPFMPTRALRDGFDALERIDNQYVGSDLPLGTYADQQINYVEGELSLRFKLKRPLDKDDHFDLNAWLWVIALLDANPKELYDEFLEGQKLKDRIFMERVGPMIAGAFVDLLQFEWVDQQNNSHDLPIDVTLLSNFVNDTPLALSLRMSDALSGVERKSIKFIRIKEIFLLDVLPGSSRVIVEGGRMSYRTLCSSGYLFRNNAIRNDIKGSDDVRIYTPLNREELRNPREEDKEMARRLLDHLNEHLERYHHLIWARMSPDRRFMLLDGIKAPHSGGRSVASVVVNKLIGIVGNSLVLPVAPGFRLDPTYNQSADNRVNLLEHYQPNTPIEPIRVALPTRGVYSEAVMGACNSCERKEEDRFWRWEESPLPDNPPSILPSSTESRQHDPGDLQAKGFPTPIIAMQNAPAAPNPTGLDAALRLMGQSGLFKDITGLEGNQRNAIEGLKAAMNTAQQFGSMASNLALQGKMSKDIDRTMRTIDTAREKGLLDMSQAKSLTESAIQGMIGAGTSTGARPMTHNEVEDLTRTAGANSAAVTVSRPTGEFVEVNARTPRSDNPVPRPVIILGPDSADANVRAFKPGVHDLGGVISLSFYVRNAPAGYTVRWMRSDTDALTVLTPHAETTQVQGMKPGITRLDIAMFDGPNQVASTSLRLCVPQFVVVDEEQAALDAVLQEYQIGARKADVLAEARRTCRHLLQKSNMRTVWRMAPFLEIPPAHLAADRITVATIRGEPPAASPNDMGWETPTQAGDGHAVYNETIDIFPGAMDAAPAAGTANPTEVDTETSAIMLQIKAGVPSPALLNLAVKVIGRLIGETLAHEVTHSLLGNLLPTGHNSPAIPNDLMNPGSERSFRQRTGIEDVAKSSPVDPGQFQDHGLNGIGGLQGQNQALMDQFFPVPPSFV
ncbi:MAG: helix-hairpin-helix domain-containing protein [Magnetococcales bacterium]|nr:helix-hairpin-helix domain-containing protein [Magnetococcales bacterium]